MEEREKYEASRAQRANENIQVRLENGLWSQKETSLATIIRRKSEETQVKTISSQFLKTDKKMRTNTSTKWGRMGCNQ